MYKAAKSSVQAYHSRDKCKNAIIIRKCRHTRLNLVEVVIIFILLIDLGPEVIFQDSLVVTMLTVIISQKEFVVPKQRV